MEVADLLRKKRLAQAAIREAVWASLKDFYDQTGFVIEDVSIRVEHRMMRGQKAPSLIDVVVRCDLDLESEAGKDLIDQAGN